MKAPPLVPKTAATPIRAALHQASSLQTFVCDGLAALEQPHRKLVAENLRNAFADSLEIDENLRKGQEQANRWDYLLGHGATAQVVALEPHSAYTGEVTTVIAKRKSAREQLKPHLKTGSTIAAWFWVASGRVDFVPHDKVMGQLAQAGITFVGERLLTRHIPPKPAKSATTTKMKAGRRR